MIHHAVLLSTYSKFQYPDATDRLVQIFSTFLFLGLIGGAAFLWVKLSSGSDGGGGSGSDGDDPLSNARRIMDKYK